MPTRQRTIALARRPGCPETLLLLLGGLLLRSPSGRGLETMASRATQTRHLPGERGRPPDKAATSGCPHRESQEGHGPPGAAAAPAAAAQESSGGGNGNQAEAAAAAPAAQKPGVSKQRREQQQQQPHKHAELPRSTGRHPPDLAPYTRIAS